VTLLTRPLPENHSPGPECATCRIRRKLALGAGLLATLLFLGGTAHADDRFESQQEIAKAIKQYLHQRFTLNDNTRFRVNRIDPRLRLHRCDQSLSVQGNGSGSPRGGRLTVQVTCNGSSPWHIYVPVRIEQMVRVVSLSRPLAAGSRITAADLSWTNVDANQQNLAYITDPKQAIGHVVQRPTQAGHILSSQDLGIAQILKRGDHVAIRAGNSGFSVTMNGVAMGSAGRGQRVSVKNSRTGTVIQGTVIDRNTVQVIN